MKKLLTLFIALFLSCQCLCFEGAAADQLDSMIFTQSYQEDYRSLMCSHNMSALVQRFTDSGSSLEKTYIVHVRAMNAPFAEVKAYHTRGETKKWSFHAFMIRKSMVFDMDFGKFALATPVSEYLEKMFFPKSVRKIQKLFYQIKPAALYSIEDFDGTMSLKDYPLRTLEGIQGLDGRF